MAGVEEARRDSLVELDATAATVDDLWVPFWWISGIADVLELDAFIHGLAPLPSPLPTSTPGYSPP